ncbi:hypothetical protein J27TS8_11310 [Robertmurraya siralis]|uniref:Uncharacterized protein n=1 Tax=Robertmurraya siralis TaxID=77777 RepID=A0A919WFQ8_9BACI|nr:hypothetical protein [Robertmurraya siralis]GIN61138.1 hypothetical protein J27TS8_11310 [Robertmurraya siralis]
MTKTPDNKKIAVDSQISLKGLVKAIFNDTIHVQIGGKVITIPIADLKGNKLGNNL